MQGVNDVPGYPGACDPSRLSGGTMIAPFIGGLGDAISMFPLLRQLAHDHPDLVIDIATTPGPAEVFELLPDIRAIRPYPLELSSWSDYQHFLSMEAVHRTGQAPGKALSQVFADAIGVSLRDSTVHVDLPDSMRWLPPELDRRGELMVGLAVGDGTSPRAYPLPKLRQIIEHLLERRVTCILLGLAGPAE